MQREFVYECGQDNMILDTFKKLFLTFTNRKTFNLSTKSKDIDGILTTNFITLDSFVSFFT